MLLHGGESACAESTDTRANWSKWRSPANGVSYQPNLSEHMHLRRRIASRSHRTARARRHEDERQHYA